MKKKIFLGVAAALIIIVGLQVHFDIPAADVEKKYLLPESKFIEINGMRVHYTDDSREKPEVVVLLHGTASSLHTWQGWAPQLKSAFHLVRVDLPAFGLTGPSPDRKYAIDNYVHFLEKFFAALKIKQITLVGNSLGGHIAWRYAAAHPDDVNKLILIDSLGLLPVNKIPLPIKLARVPLLGKAFKYLSPRFLIKNSLKEVYFDDAKITDTLVDRYQTMALRTGNREAFVDRATQLSEDTGAGLEKIKIPTLIMWGKYDAWIPVEYAERFRKRLLLQQVIIYDNAGHIPQEEIPEQTVADALKFLK